MTVQDYVNENIPRLIEQIKSGDFCDELNMEVEG